MKIRILACTIVCLLAFLTKNNAQGFVFGPKFGPSIGSQQWDNSSREPLFAYHGALFIESYEEGNPSSLFAQLGYHIRGSATRFSFNSSSSRSFKFKNIALILGARRVFTEKPKFKSYYLLGIRAEYTVSTNLGSIERCKILFPQEEFVKKFNYGFYVGAGLEFPFSEFLSGTLELSINPDISKQYDQFPSSNIIDLSCYRPEPYDIPKREIRNVSVDLSLGIRFLRKVVYID